MNRDPTTGLDYDRARWYNSSTGGYLSADPVRSDKSLYRYVGNNPIGKVDPSGLVSWWSGLETWTAPGDPGTPQTPAANPTCGPQQGSGDTGTVPTGYGSLSGLGNTDPNGGATFAMGSGFSSWPSPSPTVPNFAPPPIVPPGGADYSFQPPIPTPPVRPTTAPPTNPFAMGISFTRSVTGVGSVYVQTNSYAFGTGGALGFPEFGSLQTRFIGATSNFPGASLSVGGFFTPQPL